MPSLETPIDGRLTSQNELSGPLLGNAVLYIVSPGTAAEGNSYKVTLDTLASFFSFTGAFPTYTVATLPSGTLGLVATVSDGDSGLAWGATVINSGSGATKYAVWFNGSAWTVIGK